MRWLLRASLSQPKNRALFVVIIISMILLTTATQLEMLAIGIMTNKSADSDSSDIIQRTIDAINPYLDLSNSWQNLAIFIVFVALYKAINMFVYRYSNKKLAIYVSRDLRKKYFDHMQRLPMRFFLDYKIGSLASRVSYDSMMIADAINAALVNYIQTPFTLITTLTLCFLTSWKLSLLIFIGFPTLLLPIVYLSNKVRHLSKQLQRQQEDFTSVLIDFLRGILTVKVFAMEKVSERKYQEQNELMAHLEKKGAKYDLATRPIVHTLAMVFLSISLIWGLYGLDLSVPEAFFFCGLLHVFYEPIKKFAEQNGQIQRGIAASERMQEILSIQFIDEEEKPSFTDFSKEISFKNVSFGYGEQSVLSNISFTIKRGQKVALVGPTGSGKSTLVQLLPRLYELNEGEVLIDGVSHSSYSQKSLREKIAFVPQMPFLFLDTIADNIAFGNEYTQDAIVEAAKKAQAHEFIEKLPLQYQTQISDAGKNFSGGQQQRLAIARALIKKAPILILDEATAALDTVSEEKIRIALENIRGKVTQIIIAHRLSTIEDADTILYLEQGRLIAQGTKDELLKTCPPFQQMWQLGVNR
ncbi:MAG: ABC transporter ATP-binding protein [Waddliaceae bacterium]